MCSDFHVTTWLIYTHLVTNSVQYIIYMCLDSLVLEVMHACMHVCMCARAYTLP